MTQYELKQSLLDKMEIEGLIERIQKLEKENAELNYKLKPFLIEENKRKEYLEKRDEIDQKLSSMMHNFHNPKH
jgi:uncharacterized protein (UPF0335 family)